MDAFVCECSSLAFTDAVILGNEGSEKNLF